MTFVAFFRMLAGNSERVREEERRLARNLACMREKDKELDKVAATLSEIVHEVNIDRNRLRTAPSSHMSGEHRLNLPLERSANDDLGEGIAALRPSRS